MWGPNSRKLYYHLFSALGQPKEILEQLRHDLELSLNHHSFEEPPDALEYYEYLVNPNSDLDADLMNLDLLDQGGVKATIHLKATMTRVGGIQHKACL